MRMVNDTMKIENLENVEAERDIANPFEQLVGRRLPNDRRNVVWFSCGAASTIMAKHILTTKENVELVYCDTGGEHIDNLRFLRDVENWLNTKVTIIKNSEGYKDHFDVIEKTRYVNGNGGARCTVELKKRARFEFQRVDDIQHFGYTVEEKHRGVRFVKSFPEVRVKYPLIKLRLQKKDCIGQIMKAGIELPMMYKLGYNNNNCIGCVKGGAGYWNKIRRDFPEQFEKMAKLEREIGATCLHNKKGLIYLDKLNPKAGRHDEQVPSCDFVCLSQDV